MDYIGISNLRAKLTDIVDEVEEKIKRYAVTVSGEPKAVLISLEELESLEETAEILSAPGEYEKIMEGTKEAKEGKGTPLDEFILAKHVNGHPYTQSTKRRK